VGFRDALLFGVIYAVCNMIPLVGPIIGTLPAILTALALGDWTMVAWAVAIPIVLQQLDGYVLSPWVFRRTTQLHPVSVLVSVAIFGSLMGFVGTFLAIPMTIIVKALFEEIYLPAVNNPEVSEEHVSGVLGTPISSEPDLSVLAQEPTDVPSEELRTVRP
jgi:predicted PurR-regulated permease PerM